MKSIENYVVSITSYICSSLFFVMILVSFLQVFYRYVLNDSLIWSEELARFLFVWVAFLGSIIALHRGLHIEVDVVTSAVGKKTKKRLAILAKLSIIGLLLVLVVYGFGIVMVTWDSPSAALRIPMALVYLAIPLGAVGMLVVTIFQLIETFIGVNTDQKRGGFDGSVHTN